MRKLVKFEVSCGNCLEEVGNDARMVVEGRKGVAEYRRFHNLGSVTVKKVKTRTESKISRKRG